MAKKRMFSLDVIDLDSFIEMPVSAKLLYYDLGMRADDDGFVGNPKKITLLAGCNKEDIETLIKNKFIYMFSSGVIAIRHWNVNNQIRKDRYNETFRIDEKRLLKLENNVYELKDNSGIPNDIPTVTTVKYSIDKNSIDKLRVDKTSKEKNSLEKKREEKIIDNFHVDVDTGEILEYEIVSEKDKVYKNIIDYLNNKINANYRCNSVKTKSLIDARLNEGYKEADFFLVIDKKYKEWKDSEMEKFLRPETLFSNKFESYYNQPEIMKQRTLKDISMAEIDEALKREKQQMGDKANNDTVGIY